MSVGSRPTASSTWWHSWLQRCPCVVDYRIGMRTSQSTRCRSLWQRETATPLRRHRCSSGTEQRSAIVLRHRDAGPATGPGVRLWGGVGGVGPVEAAPAGSAWRPLDPGIPRAVACRAPHPLPRTLLSRQRASGTISVCSVDQRLSSLWFCLRCRAIHVSCIRRIASLVLYVLTGRLDDGFLVTTSA